MVATSRPARNLVFWISVGLQQCRVGAHLKACGILQQTVQLFDSLSRGKSVAMDPKKNIASDSQVWHTDTDQNSSTRKLVERSKKITVGQSLFPHQLVILPGNVEYTEKIFTYVRQKPWSSQGRQNGAGEHQRIDLVIIHFASLKAAVHLGQDYEEY